MTDNAIQKLDGDIGFLKFIAFVLENFSLDKVKRDIERLEKVKQECISLQISNKYLENNKEEK